MTLVQIVVGVLSVSGFVVLWVYATALDRARDGGRRP